MTQEFPDGTVCEVHGYVAMDKKHLNGKKCTIKQYKHVSNGYLVEFETSPYEHYNEWKFIHAAYLRLATERPTRQEPTPTQQPTTINTSTNPNTSEQQEEAPPDYNSTLDHGEKEPIQTSIVTVIVPTVQPPTGNANPSPIRPTMTKPATVSFSSMSDSPVVGICFFYCSFFCCCLMTIFFAISFASSSAADYFEGSTQDKCIWNEDYKWEINQCEWKKTGKCYYHDKCSCIGTNTRYYVNTLNNTCHDGSLSFTSSCHCNVDWFDGAKFPPNTTDELNEWTTCYIQECGGSLYDTWTIIHPDTIDAFGDATLIIGVLAASAMVVLILCGCWRQKLLCFK